MAGSLSQVVKHVSSIGRRSKWPSVTVSTSTIRNSEGSGTTAAACLWSDSTEAVFTGIGSYPQAAPRTIPQKSEQGWARWSARKVLARKPNTKPRNTKNIFGSFRLRYQVASEFAVHWRCLKIEARLWTEKLSLQQRPLFFDGATKLRTSTRFEFTCDLYHFSLKSAISQHYPSFLFTGARYGQISKKHPKINHPKKSLLFLP